MIDYRKYEPIDPNEVWRALGDGERIIAVILEDDGKYKRGVYYINNQSVGGVIDFINYCESAFYYRKGDK